MEYFYVLDYESGRDVEVDFCVKSRDSLGGILSVADSLGEASPATDLAIDGIEDFQIRAKVERLQQMFPRPDMNLCLEALNANGLDCNKALGSLELEGFQDGQVPLVLRNANKAPEVPVM